MDIIYFILIMLAISLLALGVALFIHRRKAIRIRNFTDPKHDHVYRQYNDKRKGKAHLQNDHHDFEL